MKVLASLCLILAASSALSFPVENLDFNLEEEWNLFKQKFRQNGYANNNEEERKSIFAQNLKRIKIHNYLFSKGLKSFSMGVNKFTDMTLEEFSKIMTAGMIEQNFPENTSTHLRSLNQANLPDQVDWREHGFVTPVKNQGDCGSCWAFSATAVIEGQQFRKTGHLVSLSEQNLIDCSSHNKYGNLGCHGGWKQNALQYVIDNRGIDTEESYPYKGDDTSDCQFNPNNVGATISKLVKVENESEEELKEALATVGPIAISIDAMHNSFMNYNNECTVMRSKPIFQNSARLEDGNLVNFHFQGIIDEPNCNSYMLNHAVLLVGYGTENGQDYWLIKNSWGTDWGIEGYAKTARNKNNMCGVASRPYYPLV